MSKHTPGPWFIGKGPFDYNRHIYADQKVRDEYGEQYHPLIATTSDDEPIELVDWEANARLIAAAPEMLEALCKIYSLSYGEDDDEDTEVMLVARRAIQKARGEE